MIKDGADEAVIACPDLAPYSVHLPHSAPGSAGASVWVAIRPEAFNVHKNADEPPAVPDCPPAHNVARGEIKEISYLGDSSIFHVQLSSGQLLRVSRPNRSRYEQEHFGWGDTVWVSWAGSSPVVLLS